MAAAKKKQKSKAKVTAKPAKKSKPAAKAKVQAKAKSKVVAKSAAKPAAKKLAPTPVNAGVLAAMLTPLDDRLVVAPEAAETKTAGGLFIPTTVGSRPSRGTVLAAGRGRRNKKGALRPLDVNIGDKVMFAEFSGTKITLQGNEVLILREEDILGIVTL